MRRYGALIAVVSAVAVSAAAAIAAAPTAASGRSGIDGRTVEGPTCPVERNPPDPRCAPRPISTRVQITGTGAPHRSRIVRSDAKGHFRIVLAPGTYTVQGLRRDGSPFPRPPEAQRVRVRPGRFARVTLSYDSGIR